MTATTTSPEGSEGAPSEQHHGRASRGLGLISGMKVRTRLFVMVSVLAAMWIGSVVVALNGLGSAKSVVSGSKGAFPAYQTERNAYEGWLTADDQSNMAAALASLQEPGQKSLLAATIAQIGQGHEQAVNELTRLSHDAPSAAVRASALSTLVDLTVYNGFTEQVTRNIAGGRFADAIRAVAISNANISNKTQADFNTMGTQLAADVEGEKARVVSSINSTKTLLYVVVLVGLILATIGVMLIVRSIVKPLHRLEDAARAISQGDVSHELDLDGTDEIGMVGRAFGDMSEYLQYMAFCSEEIVGGRLDGEVKVRSEKDRLGIAFKKMTDKLCQDIGDRSCLDALSERMHSLSTYCINDLQKALQAMASGDLTVTVTPRTTPVPVEPGRKGGRLADSFNATLEHTQAAVKNYEEMRQRLTGMLGEITATSSTVSAASQQMASTSEEAGRAVGEIANAMSGVATGAERQARMVDAARTSAEDTAARAGESREIAEQGVDAARRASEAMEGVRESTNSVTEATRGLAEKSEQIGGIVQTITGIASQTNLLALNAAIEAARAGEQGRGFAVVAEEVRRLAEGSQDAAKQIAELIEEIQAETQKTVTIVEEGARRTEDGVEVVDQARVAFESIGAQVEQMAEQIAQVVSATVDVSSVAEETSASTEEISASTQQTSASAQEISGSAHGLAGTADQLQSLVAQFTLERA